MISANEFCALTRLTSDALQNLVRRRGLPFDVSQRRGRGYTIFECFLTEVAQSFSENGLGLTSAHAAEVVGDLAPAIAQRWNDIRATAAELSSGRDRVEELYAFFAEASPRLGGGLAISKCGTWAEIAATDDLREIALNGLHKFFATSVSRAAAVMEIRAHRAGINLEQVFWSLPPHYRQRPKVSWSEILRRVNDDETGPRRPRSNKRGQRR